MRVGLLCLLIAFLNLGCIKTRIINLTPHTLPRSNNGLYLFEAEWDSNLRTVIPETLEMYVVINTNLFKMHRIESLTNRWEAWIPISPTQSVIRYHYKAYYQYKAIPTARPDSVLTSTYTLEIVDDKSF